MTGRSFMTTVKSRAVAMFIILLSTSLLLVIGCGRDEAKTEGCPSGTYVANDTDTLTGPADGSWTINSPFNNAFAGGVLQIAPLTYTVLDDSGAPRNKVCITFYTTGMWYSDANYSTVVNGTGSMNRVVAVTDDNGRAILYWSTGTLPPANTVTIDATVSPPTYTAGTDVSGTDWVQAYSGTQSTVFTESWTVQGEQAP
jgi:hypothetical protein